MDPDAERDVAVDLAVDDHFVGTLEHRGVAVGRGERQQHSLALLDLAVADHGVVAGDAGHRDGRVRPQELLDGDRDQRLLLDEPTAIVGCSARCHSAAPIELHVVSMPAISISEMLPRTTCIGTGGRRARR